MTERVGFSLGRVAAVAGNTFIEAVRQKVFNILLIVALIFIASASFFSQFSFSEQLKFVKDFCLGTISIFGVVIAIVGTAQLLPNELENRTVYTILAKPVRRFEFLLGKFLGSVLLIFLSLLLMTVMLVAALLFKENRLVAEAQRAPAVSREMPVADTVRQIRTEARDPDVLKAELLILVKLVLVAAITLLVSTFSTSMIFNVAVTFMIFLLGHLRGPAMEMWAERRVLTRLLTLIPDLGAFNLADDVILGHAIPWAHTGTVALYGLAYTVVAVVVAHLVFAGREI